MGDYDYDWRFVDEFELPDPIKVRKDHKCDNCDEIIKKGELAIYQEGKAPRYANSDMWSDDDQIGIEYWKSYIHEDEKLCKKYCDIRDKPPS